MLSRFFGLALLGFVLLVVSGCGTLQMEIHTKVNSPTEVEQHLSLRATGMLAGAVRDSFKPDQMRAEGFTVSEKQEGDIYTLSASTVMHASDVSEKLKVGDRPSPSNFTVTERLLDREYRLKIVIEPSQATPSVQATATPATATKPSGQPLVGGPEMDQLARQMANQMLQVQWKMTLPGEIIETNADSVQGNTAVWNLTLDRLEAGREMVVVSRERKSLLAILNPVANPLPLAAVVLVGVAFVGLVLVRR